MDKAETNNTTDQYLVEKVLSGNTKSFETIINNTKGLVAQIVFKMISNEEDRRDIAQDVYLKTFKDLPNFGFRSKLSTWIGQITYNTCLNYLEKKKLVLLAIDDNDTHDEALDAISNKCNLESISETESRFFEKEVSEIFKLEIEKLPPVYKTLITLYHNEELSYGEIVQITGLPEGTVKNYLFRARKSLKERILLKYKRSEL
ncbi:sigma-70 family RNA polymerase sigma factor [Algoriphagus sp. D3-2-R+10]|uniref:RNA polymerase sigma factor n=1 Tax=Algoriphagus aurantiacus TaxID=3103948 RepID=UPI002B364B1D|nr:sigma-70 family RNA polymerase sigma factor [Algoriphagus sp. D3-2-R+10]MEB2774687.1 sigma-70 family RNA polymerase sigma factor [Algoriphagus sp. D3-2-R+10]